MALFPEREVPLSSGDVVTVKPLMFMQLAQGAQHVDGVIRAALVSGVLTDDGDLNVSHVAGLIAEAGEHVNELILMCTYVDDQLVDREWLSRVSVEEGLDLTAAVVEVNWRGTIVKKLESLASRITLNMEQAGSTPPSS